MPPTQAAESRFPAHASSHAAARNRWLACPHPSPAARLRLICVPYAGGGTHIFYHWARSLNGFEVMAVDLPGRGKRMGEPAYRDLHALVASLAPLIPLDKPCALFGHSMGALIAFELARKLKADYDFDVAHLFASGCFAPHLPDPHPIFHLGDAEFVEELRRLEGIPDEVYRVPDLLNLMMPTIRADFLLTESYRFTPSVPLAMPLSAFGGLDDAFATRAHVEAWRQHTTGEFKVSMFSGGHFFIETAQKSLLSAIVSEFQTGR